MVTALITNVIQEDAQEEDNEEEEEKQSEPDIADQMYEVEADCEKIVDGFFNKFVINADGKTAHDTVDITLLMQAVPSPVLMSNIDEIRLFRLITLQDAIVAFENEETVTSFEYYD